MTVVLQLLADLAWVAYLACAAFIIYFAWRAVAARTERARAMFTAERDAANRRLTQALAMVAIVSLIALLVFITASFIVPALDASGSPLATPTRSSGLDQPTGTGDGGLTTPATLPTPTPTPTRAPVPTLPAPPTAEPTEPAAGGASGIVNVQFGDFTQLVSYEVPTTDVASSQPLQLTLTWEALEGSATRSYLVFTHLFTEGGDLLGQHDGGPAKPMMEWVAGETITDTHPIEFQDRTYAGPAYILVGIYDPEAGRVLTESGEDFLRLPVTLEIAAE
jgi:hypothetical protein